jgi:putative lipoic acid-binding regulatory protein
VTLRARPSGPDVTYPCRWRYQIVGSSESGMREAIALAAGDHEHSVVFSRRSRRGRYCSLNLQLVVVDEAHRNDVFKTLRSHRDVEFVLQVVLCAVGDHASIEA